MADASQLLIGLKQYLAALDLLYLRSMDFYPSLEQRWGALRASQEQNSSDGAVQFAAHWEQTMLRFGEFQAGLLEIKRKLSYRVELLEGFNRTDSNLDSMSAGGSGPRG